MDLRHRVQDSLTGSYTIERELGGGGMSRVYVADEHRLGRKVVVKVLEPELAAALSAERFEREIRLAASLQQANIVPVLSAGEAGGLPYYTMPFVEGESLRARLARGPAPIAEAVAILRDVAKALAYAHERGIVHRDIKPDNILLSGGTAVVTDFGIAKAIAAAQAQETRTTLTQLGTAVGTPAYMAPEQAAGDPATDHRADIYAFGCTAYELVTGHPPFHGMPPHKLIVAHMGEQPQHVTALRPDCPGALARLIMQCLAKDPAERPAGAEALLGALDTATSHPQLGASALAPGGSAAFARALLLYAAAFIVIAALAWTATAQLGLPSWVFSGALVVMALGLPVILFTGYVHFVTRRLAAATPTLTPGGTTRQPAPRGTLAMFALRASPHVSWKRAGRGGVLAVGGFALLVAAFLVLRALGIGPEGSLLAAGRLEAQDRVLVAGFEGAGADSSLAAVIAEAVRTNLAQSRAVTVVSTSSIVGALQRMRRPDTTHVDLALAREIAQREGIKAVVSGSIASAGTGYIITTRLVHAESGDELAAYQESADETSEIIPAVDRLTRKLRGRIGESLKTVSDAPALSQVTTASLPALQAYAAGLRANDVEGNYSKAVSLFENAIRQDSGFAAAYVQLAHSVANSGGSRARRDSLLLRAFELRDRLPEWERFAVEGTYYTRQATPDVRKSIAAFERATELDSSNSDALNSLAIGYTRVREYAKAERAYRRALAVDPGNGIVMANLVGTLILGDKMDAADSLLRAMREQRIPYPIVRREVEIAYLRGRLDSADAIARRALARGDRTPGGLEFLRSLALLRGRLREHERLFAEIRARDAARGDSSIAFSDSIQLAMMDGWHRGNRGRALGRLDAAVRQFAGRVEAPGNEWLEAAVAYASIGEAARARDMLARFQAGRRSDTTGRWAPESATLDAQSEIALAEDRPLDAVTLYRRLDADENNPWRCTFCLPLMVARGFDQAGRADSAIAHYEEYIALKSGSRVHFDAWMLPNAYRRLGELYEAKGDYARAASRYAGFLSLWERADPELQPQVADVRRRYDRVQRMVAR